jgi:PAS domain S-box-containing protein
MKDAHYLRNELYELVKTDSTIFDFIQDSALDGIWYWDLNNPEEEWMSPKFWSTLGYDYKDMPHKPSAWHDIINPYDLKLLNEYFIKHCNNPEFPFDQTVRYTHKNGSIVWIRCRGLAIRDEEGRAIRMLGSHQNITEYIKN